MTMRRNPAFDYDEALRRVDQDLETFRMLVELFVEQGPKDCAAIKAAVDLKDPDTVAKSAHRLKGAVLQFCAPAMLEAAKRMEEAGKAGDAAAAADLCGELEAELSRLVHALRLAMNKGLAA